MGDDDFDDAILGARIGRACYELYHQAASGLAPDSVSYRQQNGQALPPRDQDTIRAPGIVKKRPGRRWVLFDAQVQGCMHHVACQRP